MSVNTSTTAAGGMELHALRQKYQQVKSGTEQAVEELAAVQVETVEIPKGRFERFVETHPKTSMAAAAVFGGVLASHPMQWARNTACKVAGGLTGLFASHVALAHFPALLTSVSHALAISPGHAEAVVATGLALLGAVGGAFLAHPRQAVQAVVNDAPPGSPPAQESAGPTATDNPDLQKFAASTIQNLGSVNQWSEKAGIARKALQTIAEESSDEVLKGFAKVVSQAPEGTDYDQTLCFTEALQMISSGLQGTLTHILGRFGTAAIAKVHGHDFKAAVGNHLLKTIETSTQASKDEALFARAAASAGDCGHVVDGTNLYVKALTTLSSDFSGNLTHSLATLGAGSVTGVSDWDSGNHAGRQILNAILASTKDTTEGALCKTSVTGVKDASSYYSCRAFEKAFALLKSDSLGTYEHALGLYGKQVVTEMHDMRQGSATGVGRAVGNNVLELLQVNGSSNQSKFVARNGINASKLISSDYEACAVQAQALGELAEM